jgi:hypothetical protein
MSSHAHLGNFDSAKSHLLEARGFYADHLGLTDAQRTQFVQDGHFLDELQVIGDRALQEHPWLYCILGHAYGPYLPNAYKGNSEMERRGSAMQIWRDFVRNRTLEMTGTLGYLHLSNRQCGPATKFVEKVVLIARKYETVSPVRIEIAWPRVVLGDDYNASGNREKAANSLLRARSLDLCVQLDPELDDWSRFALPWIERVKSKVLEEGISVPPMEVSRQASAHLQRAFEHLLEAEQFEEREVGIDELCASIRRAGSRYSAPVNHTAAELEIVDRLEPFTWTTLKVGQSL